MNAATKGLLLGLANALAVGFVVGVVEAPRELVEVMVIIAILGGAPALAVGALCGELAGWLPTLRRPTLIAIPLAVVAALGMFIAPELLVPAIPSTIVAALALEWWTRPNLAKRAPGPVSPVLHGSLLGLANVVAVAVVLAIYVGVASPALPQSPSTPREVGAFVLVIGILPGMLLGAIAGTVARWLRAHRELTRLGILAGLAVTGLVGCGVVFQALPLVGPALLPTLGAVILLERQTRAIAAVPSARVHRTA